MRASFDGEPVTLFVHAASTAVALRSRCRARATTALAPGRGGSTSSTGPTTRAATRGSTATAAITATTGSPSSCGSAARRDRGEGRACTAATTTSAAPATGSRTPGSATARPGARPGSLLHLRRQPRRPRGERRRRPPTADPGDAVRLLLLEPIAADDPRDPAAIHAPWESAYGPTLSTPALPESGYPEVDVEEKIDIVRLGQRQVQQRGSDDAEADRHRHQSRLGTSGAFPASSTPIATRTRSTAGWTPCARPGGVVRGHARRADPREGDYLRLGTAARAMGGRAGPRST